MYRYKTLLTSCAVAAFMTSPALADCAEDLARMQEGSETSGESSGISKDGSLAPLQTESSESMPATEDADQADNQNQTEGEGIAKDGSHVPLEGESDADQDVAMSGQDAQAQQQAEPSADSTSDGTTAEGSGDRDALMARAQAALDAGDEEACNQALEEAAAL